MNQMRDNGNNENILLADDTPSNLQLLSNLLREKGYKTRAVPDGKTALQAARMMTPHLVLLDINMPEMNGYEVCEEMKKDPALAQVPIIFVTALDETFDKIRGFKMGAVDYVTKPFEFEEIEVRIRTHLELAKLRKKLEHQNTYLDRLVTERTRELEDAKSKLCILDRAKSDFLRLISHELRTPLCGIFGVADILIDACSNNPSLNRSIQAYEISRDRLTALVDDALLLTEIQIQSSSRDDQGCLLNTLVDQAIDETKTLASFRNIEVCKASPNFGLVSGNEEFLGRALKSLLLTAIRLSAKSKKVTINRGDDVHGKIVVVIESQGYAASQESLDSFFDLLMSSKPISPDGDLGLGPALAERLMRLNGGSVSICNTPTPGIQLKIEFQKNESN